MKKLFFILAISLAAALHSPLEAQNTGRFSNLYIMDSLYLNGTWYKTIGGLTKAQADLLYVAIQTLPPTGSISGGTVHELHSAGTFTTTLSWAATRQAAGVGTFATANLTPGGSIVVGGVSQTFSNPAAGGTISGTQNVTTTWNSNVTYNIVITTADGKTALYSSTESFLPTYYIGFVNTVNPTDANIIAALGGSQTQTSSRVASGNTATPTGAQYIMFAYPSSEGAATISINGLGVGFNLTTRAFVNASGYSQSYNIYISPNPTNSSVSYAVN